MTSTLLIKWEMCKYFATNTHFYLNKITQLIYSSEFNILYY